MVKKVSVKNVSRILMISTIILIGAFQFYWINRLYNDEWQALKKETDVVFRDVMYRLQLDRFRSDTGFFSKQLPENLFIFDVIDSVKEKTADSIMHHHILSSQRQLRISIGTPENKDNIGKVVTTESDRIDSLSLQIPDENEHGAPSIVRYFSTQKNINDSLPVRVIDSAYKRELAKNGITLGFSIKIKSGKEKDVSDSVKPNELKTNFLFVGLSQARAYQAEFSNPFNYIFGKIKMPLIFSLLLIAFAIVSFIFLYRNMLHQRKLAAIKNEFISNVTHELKTPIATVNVAIEALRNFNAIENPEKTKEYLDISAAELQRLSLLVDKVLKLSMFENKEIELNKEQFDLYSLTEEVIATMKLQFDKTNAQVTLSKKGEKFIINADRLHIASVLYNLLDNALKYSRGNPQIDIALSSNDAYVEICISDKGIGIAAEYKQKIFEKFFRVPSNEHHNIKGYGLGLSYVNHIAQLHHGFIEVKSELGKGSCFCVKIP